MTIPQVTVTGTYEDAEGNPATGQVTFRLNSELVDPVDDVRVLRTTHTATLVNGSFSITLDATSGGDITPDGLLYRVVEQIGGARTIRRYVALPSSSPAVDLADLLPAEDSDVVWTTGMPYILPGPSGGDDSAALQTAIDNSAAGSRLTFRPGTYLLSAPLELRSGRAYIGASPSSGGTIIKQKDGLNILAAAGGLLVSRSWNTDSNGTDSPIVVERLYLDGNLAANASSTCHGMVILSWDCRIVDCRVNGFAGDGIRLPSTTKDGSAISGTSVESRIVRCKITDIGGDGVRVADTSGVITDGWITDCAISDTDGHGIHLERSAGWQVRGNHLYSIGKHGVFASHGYGTFITDNYIESFGNSATTGTYEGIRASDALNSRAVIIRGNQVSTTEPVGGSTYRLILVHAGVSQAATFIVSDNVGAAGGAAVAVAGAVASGGTVSGVVSNNTWKSVGQNVSTGFPGGLRFDGNEFQFAAAAPSSGYWQVGMRVWNTSPSAGGAPGWVCVTSGAPGTWKAMANLAS